MLHTAEPEGGAVKVDPDPAPKFIVTVAPGNMELGVTLKLGPQ